MDGDEMRRGNNFFQKNRYKIAAVCVAAAVLGLVGVYMLAGRESSEAPKEQVAVEETEQSEKEQSPVVAQQETEESTEQTTKASAVIEPKSEEEVEGTEVAQIAGEDNTEQTVSTGAAVTKSATAKELHFDTERGLLWPVSGSVILDYSMDQTVYFTTLDQYKYNPAVIISGNVNDKVKAAASGKITEISTSEVTGCTVTMDIGDGYTAIYGQLKEVPYEVGAYVEAGNTLGFVSEPTKYFSLEGSNLYFALQKDGVPMDPVEFFQ